LRKDLPEFLLRGGANGAGVVEDDRPGTRRALIERENASHAGISGSVAICRASGIA
jgi:hypothetical protein